MKELSIEEKAKRYDEIIKKTNKMHHENCEACQMCIEELIPELKESENWIPKEIIKYLKEKGDFRSCWIAWLEKQGEKKGLDYPHVTGWRKNYKDNKPKVKHSVLMFTTHGIAEGEWLGDEWCQYRWSCKIKDEDVLYWLHLSDLENLERENFEQKPADKVEPKFKVGDWITNGEEIGQVIEWNHPNCIGYKTTYGTEKAFNKEGVSKWHKFTIQDAKVGDVLTTNNGYIFIYHKHDNNYVYYYYSTNYYNDISLNSSWNIFGIKPATKEQRDALMKAMTDAGYTFSFEKKELKKIEQKTITLEQFKNFFKKRAKQYEIELPNRSYDIHAFCEELYDLLSEQKSTVPAEWSEEDEGKLKSILFHIEDVENKDVIDWLKSLKDRVQLQPKQEWSEEDERMYRGLHNSIYSNPYREEFSDWLKSLKDRYTWKPSDEQIKVCKEVYADILSSKGFDLGTVNSELNRLEEQLKKIKG